MTEPEIEYVIEKDMGPPLISRNHRLKCWPHWFEEIAAGRKTFDIRSTKDRCFNAGDTLELFSWDPEIPQHPGYGIHPMHQAQNTGLFVNVIAVYHDLPGLQPGYCVMAIALPQDFKPR